MMIIIITSTQDQTSHLEGVREKLIKPKHNI